MAAGAHVAGILVEIDFVSAKEHLRVLDFGLRAGRTAQFVDVADDVLGLPAEVPIPEG